MHVVACTTGMTGGDLPSSCAGSVPTHDSYTQITSQLCSQCCTDKSYTAVSVSRAIQGGRVSFKFGDIRVNDQKGRTKSGENLLPSSVL